MPPPRVTATQKAAVLTRQLAAKFGPLLFHQSGGCCEGTAPMCFRQSDFRIGQHDLLLGSIDSAPFYIGVDTFRYFANCQLLIDVIRGGGDSFSLEAPEGVRFITRSRLFTETELRELECAGPPPSGEAA
jgi:uncharacterized protein